MLSGGTAFDYSEHVCSTVDYLPKLHSNFHELSYSEVRDTMISNINFTMTDRATVNQASIPLINAAWKKRLNMLYCHLYPLNTIATNIKKCLRTLEDSKDSRHLSPVGCVAEQNIGHI